MTYRQSLYQLMVSLIIALVGSGFVVAMVMAAPPSQPPEGELYIVQAGDWLSKIAEKYYQDPAAYPLIVVATNFKANSDPTFTYITSPEALEVGQKLWIPARPPKYALPTAPDILAPVAELSALSPGALAFSPDDQWLAVGDGQGIQLWQTQNWQLRWSVPLRLFS